MNLSPWIPVYMSKYLVTFKQATWWPLVNFWLVQQETLPYLAVPNIWTGSIQWCWCDLMAPFGTQVAHFTCISSWLCQGMLYSPYRNTVGTWKQNYASFAQRNSHSLFTNKAAQCKGFDNAVKALYVLVNKVLFWSIAKKSIESTIPMLYKQKDPSVRYTG